MAEADQSNPYATETEERLALVERLKIAEAALRSMIEVDVTGDRCWLNLNDYTEAELAGIARAALKGQK